MCGSLSGLVLLGPRQTGKRWTVCVRGEYNGSGHTSLCTVRNVAWAPEDIAKASYRHLNVGDLLLELEGSIL